MIAYTPSEDPRYGFAVGRVRSREARILSRQQFERLSESRSEDQIISSLADTPYSETRADDVDTMLGRAEAEEEAFFLRYLEEEDIRDFFNAPNLASNLKLALRRLYGAEIDDSLFVPKGSPSIEVFKKMLEGESVSAPLWLKDAAGEAVAANIRNVDAFSIDVIIDNALVEHLYLVSKGYSFLRAILVHQVDSTNLLTFLRLRFSEGEWDVFEKGFLPYGAVKIERFKILWEQGRDGISSSVLKIDSYKSFSEGLKAVSESFLLLEKQIKESELLLLLSTRRLTFGYEPLVGYALIKREERKNIARVATGLRYGLEKETVRNSIAWFD